MTNQTQIFCVADISPTTGVANVTAAVNSFIYGSMKQFQNFHILPVVVSPATSHDVFWFTVQVNYYDPKVQDV